MAETDFLLKTPLYDAHKELGARLVDFGGWALPVSYHSQVEEHHAVRDHVGMFDVSHMLVTDITGANTLPLLSELLANDINKVSGVPGKALYSCMLNESGGVIDDLIVYYLGDEHCRLVTNAATSEKDIAWLKHHAASYDRVAITAKPELALIAVQGPKAIETIQRVFSGEIAELVAQLKRFQGGFVGGKLDAVFIGRTGYTGEDGVEMMIPRDQTVSIWSQLSTAGVQACGLGARDTLRLEAGMALYGSDLDENHTPIESGLSWTVAMKDERDFIGRQALTHEPRFQMIGLVLEGKGVLRSYQPVLLDGQGIGEITSGTFSPSLNQSIALARVNAEASVAMDAIVQVQIRQKLFNARVVKYPFIAK